MFKYGLVFWLVFLIQNNVSAQSVDSSVFKGSEAYLTYGLHFMDRSSLNNDLKKYGLPEFGSTQMHIGFGGGAFLKRFYVGGQGQVNFGSNASNPQYQTSLVGGSGMVQGGYVIIQTPSVAFYPALGIGGGGSAIRIDKGNSYVENNGELHPDHNIHTGYMLLNFSLNNDFFVSKAFAKNKFLVGVSAGYQIYPFSTNWTYQDERLSGFSKFNHEDFYVKIKIGLMFSGEK